MYTETSIQKFPANFIVLNQTQKVFLHKYLNFNTIFHHDKLSVRPPLLPPSSFLHLCSFFSQLEAFQQKKLREKFSFSLLSNSCYWKTFAAMDECNINLLPHPMILRVDKKNMKRNNDITEKKKNEAHGEGESKGKISEVQHSCYLCSTNFCGRHRGVEMRAAA